MAPKKTPTVASEPEPAAAIVIDSIPVECLRVPIVGTSPLLVHKFSEKARRILLDNMQGRKKLKDPKDPEAEYQAAFYRVKGGGYGMPAAAFKQATVAGARFYSSSVTMTALRTAVFVRGELGTDGESLVPIQGEPHRAEHYVRVGRGSGGADLRYRPQFDEWSAVLTVVFVPSMLTRGSVTSLIDAGGLGVGVGDWRPEKDGDFGTYRVDSTRDIEVVALT